MSKLNIGDVVVLKSGSDRMTVNKVNDDGTYQCIWRENNTTQQEDFNEAVLEIYESGIRWGSNPKRNNHW